MTCSAKCRVCGKQISADADDGYIGDPHKLIPLLTCDTCYDFRDARDRLNKSLERLCSMVHFAPDGKRQAVCGIVRPKIERVLKTYCMAVASRHGFSGMSYSDEMLDMVISHPDKWPVIIGKYTTDFPKFHKLRPVSNDP